VRSRALSFGLADPLVGNLPAAAGLDLLVEAVVGDVQLAVGEPRAMRGIPLERLRRLFEPRDELAVELAPEPFEVLVRPLVDTLVRDDRAGSEVLRGRERALLLEESLDGSLGVLGLLA
jgi:hypothetical protein